MTATLSTTQIPDSRDATDLEANDAQKHQLHVKDVWYLIRILGQVHQLLKISWVVFLAFACHIQGCYSHLHHGYRKLTSKYNSYKLEFVRLNIPLVQDCVEQ